MARDRFTRFDKDSSEHVTSGARSETQVIKDIRKGNEWAKRRLKIFDRSIDGRTPVSYRVFKHKSAAENAINTRSRSLADETANFQKRASHADFDTWRSVGYLNETCQNDFAVAKYSDCRKSMGKPTDDSHLRYAETDTDFSKAIAVKNRRVAVNLMKDLIQQKHAIDRSIADGDINYSTSAQSVAAKSAQTKRDLIAIMNNIVSDQQLGVSAGTPSRSTARRQYKRQGADTEISHEIARERAQAIFKSLKPGATMEAMREVVAEVNEPTWTPLTAAKSMSTKVAGVGPANAEFTMDSNNTVNYKNKLAPGELERVRNFAGEEFKKESMNTAMYSVNHKNVAHAEKNTAMDLRFYDTRNGNYDKGGTRMGSKYTMRNVAREESANELDEITGFKQEL